MLGTNSFTSRMQNELHQIDTQIEKIKSGKANLKLDDQVGLQIDELKAQKNNLQEKLNHMLNRSEEELYKSKEGFQSIIDNIKSKLRDISA